MMRFIILTTLVVPKIGPYNRMEQSNAKTCLNRKWEGT